MNISEYLISSSYSNLLPNDFPFDEIEYNVFTMMTINNDKVKITNNREKGWWKPYACNILYWKSLHQMSGNRCIVCELVVIGYEFIYRVENCNGNLSRLWGVD